LRENALEVAATDPDLARILDAWPALAEPIRRAVLALIRTAGRSPE
jgi:hypothetical protein